MNRELSVGHLYILGVRVDDVDQTAALQIMAGYIESGVAHQVVTINPEFIIAAQQDEEFKAILNGAALALPDGVGILWAARFLGRPLKGRAPGVDTTQGIAALAAQRGYRLFLLGAAPGVAERTAARLIADHPALTVVGTHAGSPSIEEEDEIVALIQAARPHVLFVAYGAPHQDRWIHRNLPRLEVPVAMGVGGAFDFISGVAQRAPRWMRNLGLEWCHRLLRQPWRWRRMLALPRFIWLIVRSRLKNT